MPASPVRRVSVLICDDHPIVSGALKLAVEASPVLCLAAEPVSHGIEAIEVCRRRRPDVCVMDVNLGGEPDGIAATRAIREVSEDTRVLVLSGFVNDEMQLSAIEAGAIGFVHKGESLDSLLQAISDAGQGKSVIDHEGLPRLVERTSRERAARRDARDRLERLTPREREVLDLIRAGNGNHDIAAILYISPRTVETHIKHLLRKMGARSKLHAVAIASRAGGDRSGL
jgi:DNA-binding NarL/FixJ family response regulator